MPQESKFIYDLLKILTGAGAGIFATWLTYWLVGRRRITLAHRHRMTELMVEKLHQYTQKYYMPIINAAHALSEDLDARIKKTQTTKDYYRSFYFLTKLLHSWYARTKMLGGYFLRDNTVGYVLQSEEGAIRKLIRKFVTPTDASILLKSMKSSHDDIIPFVDFRHVLTKPLLKQISVNYGNWLQQKTKEVKELIHHLRCYYDLFLFEINTIYQAWSREKPSLKHPDLLRQAIVQLPEAADFTTKHKTKLLKKLGL